MVRCGALALVLAVAFGAVVKAGASPARDGAVIVDSGSTNTSGYRIEIRSDGTATITLQNRAGAAQGAAKAFSVASGVAARFFADLKAARAGNVTGSPCMKSASFGTTTRVSWHGWASPDLDCPAENPLLSALIRDVNLIRAASGIGSLPGVHRGAGSGGPIRAEPSPPPGSSPPKENLS
jgi:hypothetical protein